MDPEGWRHRSLEEHALWSGASGRCPSEWGAEATGLGCLPPICLPGPRCENRRFLSGLQRQAANRLRMLLAAVFPEIARKEMLLLARLASAYPTPADVVADPDLPAVSVRSPTRLEISGLAVESVGVSTPALRESVQTWASHIVRLTEEIRELERWLAVEVSNHPYGEVLLSFPAISTVTAALLNRPHWRDELVALGGFHEEGLRETLSELPGAEPIFRGTSGSGRHQSRALGVQGIGGCHQAPVRSRRCPRGDS